MNRKQRRANVKKGTIDPFDPNTTFKLKYDVSVPGGLLRDPHPAQFAGRLDAPSEADMMRATIVRLLSALGYTTHDRAIIGCLAEVFNPFGDWFRGALAYALVQGTGLTVTTDEVEVCKGCGAERQRMLAPPDMQTMPDDLCTVCDSAADEDIHKQDSPDWNHDFEEPEPVILDSTQHQDKCTFKPKESEEGSEAESESVSEPEWVTQEAVVLLQPQRFPSLNTTPPKTGETGETEMPDLEPLEPDSPDNYEFTTYEELEATADAEQSSNEESRVGEVV